MRVLLASLVVMGLVLVVAIVHAVTPDTSTNYGPVGREAVVVVPNQYGVTDFDLFERFMDSAVRVGPGGAAGEIERIDDTAVLELPTNQTFQVIDQQKRKYEGYEIRMSGYPGLWVDPKVLRILPLAPTPTPTGPTRGPTTPA